MGRQPTTWKLFARLGFKRDLNLLKSWNPKLLIFFLKYTDSGLDSQVALVNSHDYMTLLGHTVIAWTWLRVAVAAAQVLCVGVGVCWSVLVCVVVCCSVCCSVLQYDCLLGHTM